MIYIYLLLLALCLEYFVILNLKINVDSKRNLFLLLVFIEISLFLGVRDSLSGTDTIGYLHYYYEMGDSSVLAQMHFGVFEIGYAYLNKLLYLIVGYHPAILFCVLGALTIGPVLYTLQKGKYVLLSVLTWCILNGLNTAIANLRQAVALSWCLLGYFFLLKRKYWLALFTVLFAASFHLSAICMVIIFPLYYIAKRTKLTPLYLFGCILPVTVLIVIFIRPFLEVLINLSGVYTSYLARANTGLGSILYCIFTFFIFMVSYLTYHHQMNRLDVEQQTNFKFLLFLNLIGFVLYTATIHGGSTRMALYFTSIYVWLLPMIPLYFTNKRLQLVGACMVGLGLICVLFIFSFIPSGFANEASSYVPFFMSR